MNVAMDKQGQLWAHRNGITKPVDNLRELDEAKKANKSPYTVPDDTLLTWEEAEAILIARDL